MSKNKQQMPDIREMLGGLGNAAAQAQSRATKDQTEIYRNGPWWNFLQFTGMRCGDSGVRCPADLFKVARAAMSMQCMMYGGEVVEREHFIKCSREDISAFVKDNGGRLMYSIEPNIYLYVFPRGAVFLDADNFVPPSVSVLTSDENLCKSINEFLEKLNE
jgi:hypothetical protein